MVFAVAETVGADGVDNTFELTVKLKVAVLLPFALVAVSVNELWLKVPVGVPVMAPVLVFNDIPVGSAGEIE